MLIRLLYLFESTRQKARRPHTEKCTTSHIKLIPTNFFCKLFNGNTLLLSGMFVCLKNIELPYQIVFFEVRCTRTYPKKLFMEVEWSCHKVIAFIMAILIRTIASPYIISSISSFLFSWPQKINLLFFVRINYNAQSHDLPHLRLIFRLKIKCFLVVSFCLA